MKTFKLLIPLSFAFCLMLITNVSMAMQPSSKVTRLTTNYTLKTYIDAVHLGKLKGLSEVIDDNAKFTLQRGDQVLSMNKTQILQSLKKQENIEQNCEVTQSIIQTLPNQIIVKVDLKYENFTRSNYVTLSETNSGWKVSQVSSAFK